jgi:nucleotide-binding universal stress UspA family protein
MDILCGIDFTEPGGHACQIAAQLAARLGDRLVLAHVFSPSGVPDQVDETAHRQDINDELQRRVVSLQTTGIEVTTHLLEGPVESSLLDLASRLAPRLLVIGSGLHRQSNSSFRDSIAAHLLLQTHYPMLLVGSQPRHLASWHAQGSPLRTLSILDSSPAASAALSWLEELRCRLPIHLHAHDLSAAEGRFANWQQIPSRLEDELREHPADLLVLGIDPRALLEDTDGDALLPKLLACDAALHLCVPAHKPALPSERRLPDMQTVLVACDLSVGSSHAAAYHAYALLRGRGGKVHLCHVCAHQTHVSLARSSLEALIPAQATGYGVSTEVHVIVDAHPGQVLGQLAETLPADMLCLGTHGRSAFSQMLTGSTVRDVHQHTSKPVLLVRDD